MTGRNKQVALALPSSAPSMNPKIPGFLQKLYTLVSDPETDDVICWSESGDSFFVLDPTRLATERLGAFFKHNKFASFVRQLNMYGFHKIPHLQQGALRSSSEAEYSQFAHPDFHRGQEDRLILIERKKQTTMHPKEQGVVDFPSVAPQSVPQPQTTDHSTDQALDIHAIINGIAAIRRHQVNLSSELNELKSSNQLLWQESMEARSRHQKQQDTLNSIIKFLAGVFGHQAANSGAKEKERGGPSSHSVVRGSRLMIEDKKRDLATRVGIVEVQDEEAGSPASRAESPGSTSHMTSPYPSPATEISSFSAAATPRFDLTYPPSEDQSTPLANSSTPSTSSQTGNNTVISTQPKYPGTSIIQQDENMPTFSPSRSPALDDRIQTALSYLTPADLQQLFTALNNQPGIINDSLNIDSLQQGTQHQNQLPISPPPSQSLSTFNFGSLSPQLPSQSAPGLTDTNGLISFTDVPYLEQWKQASDIEQEVEHINSGIDLLIHDLGIDPVVVADAETNQAKGGELDTSILDTSSLPSLPDSVSNDELFDSFLNTFPSPALDNNLTGTGGATMEMSFPVVPPGSPSATATTSLQTVPPAERVKVSDGPGANTRAQKRKSDVSGEVMSSKMPSNPKTKKRKDK
ncbi:transcription factor Hsf1 [Lentinula edodes]|nr:transcription factor Hsf1 [Lentinula edodes]